MKLMEVMKKYYHLKSGMESSGIKYGLTDSRTLDLSKELDLLIDEIMKLKHPGLISTNKKHDL
jgi:hypothetical protein